MVNVAELTRGARVVLAGVSGLVERVRADAARPSDVRVLVRIGDATQEVAFEALSDVQLPDFVYGRAASESSAVTNTARLYRDNPMLGLLGALDDLSPGRRVGQSIEDMEARGQHELIRQKTKLPADGSESPAWAKLGIVFGPPVEGDPLFREVKLPVGWALKATDHAMWSGLFDPRGFERAHIFYKAAFYDRSAHVSLRLRYFVKPDNNVESPQRRDAFSVVDAATGTTLFTTETLLYPAKPDIAFWERRDALERQAVAWLQQHRPLYRDPVAYWGWD